MAGTDAHGFRLPPDGGVGCAPLPGTDQRGFRRPPDLRVWPQLAETLTKPRREMTLMDVGTNELRFWGAPDPARVGLNKKEHRDVSVRTKERSFWVPPDRCMGLLAVAA